MFKSVGSFLGFIAGLALTVGLLLTPHLLPWGYGIGLKWNWLQITLAAVCGLFVLAATLWGAGKLISGARSWKEGKLILGVIIIALVANTLFSMLVEFFKLQSGLRALVAVLGVPVIYGYLGAVLGKISLKESMLNILSGALTTMGVGFIIAALIRGW
jgi:hypothetical protein